MSSELQTGKAHSPHSGYKSDKGIALNEAIEKASNAIQSAVLPAGNTLPEGWSWRLFEDVCSRISVGHVGETTAFFCGAEGVPLLRSQNVRPGVLDTSDIRYVTEEFHHKSKKSSLMSGDILIVRVGQNRGDCAVVPEGMGELNCANIVLATPIGKYSNYFGYYFNSPKGKEALLSLSSGSAQLVLNTKAIAKLPVPYPPEETAIAVGELGRNLDDRISLLRETNATLEAMAQALFKSWFVDFDPVHANAGTRAATLPAELQALFPSTFTVTPQGLVPDGWQVGVVGDVAQQKKGSINPMQAPERLFEHYSLPAFDSNQAPVLEQGEKIKSNKTPLPPNAVLLSKLNPHIPRVWLPFGYADSAVCSTEFLVYSPINGASKEFIYALFTSVNFLMNLQQLVTGTSNSHQRVKPDHVIGLELVIPSQDILAEFESAVKPLFERIGHNRQQAQTLVTLRDTLLPRLISGQLRLPDAEAALAEAGA